MRKLGSIWALILLLLFLCSAMVLLVFGVTIYTQVTRSSQDQADLRVPIQYLSDSIRQADIINQVSVRTVQGTDVLVFTERVGQTTYETWIYGYRDKLYKINKREAGEFNLREGRVVAKAHIAGITEIQPNLIKIKFISKDDREYSYIFTLRSKLKVVQYEA